MNLPALRRRLTPLSLKLRGKLPLCPWRSVLSSVNPRTLSAYPPPTQIEVLEEDEGYKKLRFNRRHDAWFPRDTAITPEMWSEYLCVFWEHPANSHRYLSAGTMVRSGDICLDCGACEGFFTWQALEAGAAKVVCLEPNSQMAECLRLTFAPQIEAGKVIVHNVAVGASDGEAVFEVDRLNPFGGSLTASAQSEVTKVQTIERICAELSVDRIDFIKMDIEGAELQAVEGAIPLLRRHHPRLAITTYHRSFHFAALKSLLTAAGYGHVVAAGNVERNGGTPRPVMLHAWQ